MTVLAVSLARIIELAYVATYTPQLVVERMTLEATLVGVLKHAVGDTRGIAYAKDVDTTLGEFLADPVHRHIALRADKHLHLATEGLVDGLHEGSGLACTRRSVHHGHILGMEYHVGSLLLRGIEPGETHGFEGKLRGRSAGVADVAQLCQTVVFSGDDGVESLEHEAIGVLVEIELHSQTVGIDNL